MKIAYENENVQLWHGDCREWSGKADVLLTDPPTCPDEYKLYAVFAWIWLSFEYWEQYDETGFS